MKTSIYVILSLSLIGTTMGHTDGPIVRRSPWYRRDATTVLNDLKVVDPDLKQYKIDCESYTGSSAQVLTLNKDVDKLNKDINQTTTDCNATTNTSVTAAQASAIIAYCQNPLEPDIKAALACLKKQRATFTANGLKPTVQSQMNQLKTNVNTLTTCLVSKTPTAQKSAISSCVALINADIQDAIAYYA